MSTVVRHYMSCVEAHTYFSSKTDEYPVLYKLVQLYNNSSFCAWILLIRYFVFFILVLLSYFI